MRRTICGGCDRSTLETILDLGSTPLADYFPASPNEVLKTYPLQLAVCTRCWLVQQTEIVPDAELFGKTYSFFSGSSPSLVEHLKLMAAWAKVRFPKQIKQSVIEIACNDGTLLKEFDDRKLLKAAPVFGIDPAGPPTDAAREAGLFVISEPFTYRLAKRIGPTNGLVIANNVIAHVADLDDFVAGISTLVGDHGVFVGEFQYLPDLLAGNAFDMVYHEHRSFLSVTSLEPIFWRNGLVIVETHPQPTQGGSMRIVARRRVASDNNFISFTPSHAMPQEAWLREMGTYAGLQGRVEYLRMKIRDAVGAFVSAGNTVAGYAASAKSTTLLNYCGIDRNMLDYVVDTTPHKFNKFTPGTNIPILSTAQERVLHGEPDAYLLLASNYLGGVIRREFARNGNCPKLIVPLPAPVVI